VATAWCDECDEQHVLTFFGLSVWFCGILDFGSPGVPFAQNTGFAFPVIPASGWDDPVMVDYQVPGMVAISC
jgi:hypothetical protein